jgi:hypothetical protein
VYTLDCLAWALHRNHDDAAAAVHIERALAVGVKDPQLLYHAGIIEKGLKGRELAMTYLREECWKIGIGTFWPLSRCYESYRSPTDS